MTDLERVLEALRSALRVRGETVEMGRGVAGEEARMVHLFETARFDLVVCDLMPMLDGTGARRGIRVGGQDAILLVTARDREGDDDVGLMAGDDDRGVLAVSGIRLDQVRHEVTVRGTLVDLPLKEYRLLEALMENRGRVLTRQVLIDRVWGPGYSGDPQTVDVHVKRLRAKIEVDRRNPALIVTVRGIGYRFER